MTAGSGRLRRFLRMAVIDVRPLRHRDFRLLFIGRGASFLGSMIRNVAVPFQIYSLTHSSLAVGMLGLAELVPILAFAFLGGALADAHDRRRMVQLTELALVVMTAMLVGNSLLSHPLLWLIYLVTAFMAALDALQRPSLDAMLPRLVPRSELTAAGALSTIQGTIGMIAGPAVGGILIATIGLAETYAVDVIGFAISQVALWMMRAVPPPLDAQRPSIARVLEGLRYARSRQDLLGTYLIDMVAMFFGMPQALFPAIAAGYGGPRVLGLLYAAPAVGSFLITGTSGWSSHVHHHGRAIILSAICWGAAITAFGFSRALPLALVFLSAAGAADTVSGIFRSTIWNQTIPDALRGRLASIELLSYSTGPTLGDLESGTVASIFSVRTSVVSGGILCVAGTILTALFLPRFWNYDARTSPHHIKTEVAGPVIEPLGDHPSVVRPHLDG